MKWKRTVELPDPLIEPDDVFETLNGCFNSNQIEKITNRLLKHKRIPEFICGIN